MVRAGAVKIQIGKNFFFTPHDLLDALGDRVKFLVALAGGKFFRPGFDDIGARIGNFVDAMTEAHNQFLRRKEFDNAFFCFAR